MNIYFPFEGQARELNARIHFCVEAAKRGHNAYFGHKSDLEPLVPKLKPGIFFHKSVQLRKLNKIIDLKKLGHFNASIDEEGLIRDHDEIYFGYRLSKESINLLDIFFSWGDEHTQTILNHYPEFSSKVFSAGNSRIDVLKKNLVDQKKISFLKKKYGRFILFAGKFPRCNGLNYKKFGSYPDAVKTNNLKNLSDNVYKFLSDNVDWERENMIGFMEAIKECAITFKDRKIIIRPHPTENLKPWYEFVENCNLENIIIDADGNTIIPWILASEKIISHNCTTAVESAFLGVKTINYIPVHNSAFEFKLPLLCSDTARDIEELKLLINKKNDEYIFNENQLKFYIKNCGSETFCDYSMSIIENIANKKDLSKKNKSLNPVVLNLKKFITFLKRNYSLYLGNHAYRRDLYKQKFSGFGIGKVKNIINLYSSKNELEVIESWPGVFLIKKLNNP